MLQQQINQYKTTTESKLAFEVAQEVARLSKSLNDRIELLETEMQHGGGGGRSGKTEYDNLQSQHLGSVPPEILNFMKGMTEK